MKKRPWVPVAVVLWALIGATIVAGIMLGSRLSEAELALEPFTDPGLAAIIDEGDDFPTPPCENTAEIADAFRSFYAAVDLDREQASAEGRDPEEISSTGSTFDSIVLDSVIARLSSGRHQLLLRTTPSGGAWCLDEVEFSTGASSEE
mgnify:CR=1 FL=1